MHRLLQGDVGSGKTIVALFASLLAMENGYQAAVMAPTELLAEQHLRTFTRLLEPLGIRPVLVTGRLTTKVRREAAALLARPAPLLVVGTHALVQDSTAFARLGLAVVDEQHRFGVEQRKAFGAKGAAPRRPADDRDADPALARAHAYGDLDVSVLDEKPAGSAADHERAAARERARPRDAVRRITSSRRGDRRTSSTRSSRSRRRATSRRRRSRSTSWPRARSPGGRVGLLHGRMSGDEKDAIDARVPRRGARRARGDDGDRGRHRRSERDGDADRAPRALRAVATAPAPRTRRSRR